MGGYWNGKQVVQLSSVVVVGKADKGNERVVVTE